MINMPATIISTPTATIKKPALVHILRKHKRLAVIATPEIKGLFSDAPEIVIGNYPYRVIKHEQSECALLRRLGYPAGNPMLEYYDWCGGTPFKVQRSTCDLLTNNQRAYVFNDMGTGKTKAALWAWDWLKLQGISNKLLIVAPLSTLKFVWQGEIFDTIRHRYEATGVLHGSRDHRLDILNNPTIDIFIINHDGIGVIEKELLARTDIDAMIIDELASFRNPNKRSRQMRNLAETKKIVWGMTGSPMPNAATDVWMQASIVTPNTVPKYFSHVRDVLMTRKAQHIYVAKDDATEKAFHYVQPNVRYSLDDVTELPDLIERNIDVAMTPEQKKVYEGIVRHCVALAANKQITAVNAAVAMGKLLQIAGGWVYSGDNKEVATLDATPRMTALIDTVMACRRKVIVFSPFVHALHGIADRLKSEGIDFVVVHGGVNNRDVIFNAFQNTPRYKVLLAHPKTMAHGITLTAADTIVWYLPVTSYEIYEQANARIRRVGQKHKQQIIHIVASAVERRVYSLLRAREKVQTAFLGLLANATNLLNQ